MLNNIENAMRILLIEDDKDIRSAVESLLLAKQYTVDWLDDGQEALHALTRPVNHLMSLS